MEARLCARCKEEPINLKYGRYCDSCRPHMRGKHPKYVWTPERDQLLRDRYKGTIKYRAGSIAVQLGWPRWVITRRAAVLGLTQPVERHEWSAEETEFLKKHAGKRTANWLAKQLHRSMTSVVLKLKRLKISRAFRDGYTLRRLEACFGSDHRIIQGWIQDGKLRAQRRFNSGAARDAWYTTDQDVLRFILRFPQEFRLDRVDQPWFMGLILAALRRPTAAPATAEAFSKTTAPVQTAPPGTRCALCDRVIKGAATSEERPSGSDGEMETWWYCLKCKAA